MFNPVRWTSEDDRYLGPFTYVREAHAPLGFILDGQLSAARLHLLGHTLIMRLPQRWMPYRWKLGFDCSDHAIHLYYGRQTDEWPSPTAKIIFYPWQKTFTVSHVIIPPDAIFQFKDYDGEEILATTRIEETVTRSKWFGWLLGNKTHRRLRIEFSSEVGPQKGTWKGGVVGTSEPLLENEMHVSGFNRYCEEHGLTYIGRVVADG